MVVFAFLMFIFASAPKPPVLNKYSTPDDQTCLGTQLLVLDMLGKANFAACHAAEHVRVWTTCGGCVGDSKLYCLLMLLMQIARTTIWGGSLAARHMPNVGKTLLSVYTLCQHIHGQHLGSWCSLLWGDLQDSRHQCWLSEIWQW